MVYSYPNQKGILVKSISSKLKYIVSDRITLLLRPAKILIFVTSIDHEKGYIDLIISILFYTIVSQIKS